MTDLTDIEQAFAQAPEMHAADFAQALCQAGRAKEAAAALEKLQMKKPLDARASVALARAYFDVFRPQDAERLLAADAIASYVQDDGHAQCLLAELRFEAEQRDEAATHAERALALDASDTRAKEILILLGRLPPDDTGSSALERLEKDGVEARPPSLAGMHQLIKMATVTTVVLAVIVVVYWQRGRVATEVGELVRSARVSRDKMDRASLQDAVKQLAQAKSLLPSSRATVALLAEVQTLLALEYDDGAAKQAVAGAIADAADADAQTGERYFAEAMAAVTAGAATKAEALTQRVIESGGVDGRVLLALGMAQKELGKINAAKDSLRRAYDLNPYNPLIALELGDVFLLENDIKNADFYWRKAASAATGLDRAVLRAAWGKLLSGDDPEVIKRQLEPLARTNLPSAARSALLLAQAEIGLATGQRAEAVAAATEAKKIRSSDAAVLWAAAHVFGAAGLRDALAVHDLMTTRFPGVEAIVFETARAAARFGKLADAETVLQRTPDVAATARAQALLAELALSAGDSKKAEELVRAVLKADARQPEALYVLGRIHEAKNESQKALESYSRALEQKPGFAEVYHQVGAIFIDNKEYQKGREQLLVADKMYRESAVRGVVLARLYEDIAKSYERAGGAAEAGQWRAKAKAYAR